MNNSVVSFISYPPPSEQPAATLKDEKYRVLFNRRYVQADYAQYRCAPDWETACDAAKHLGRIDVEDVGGVMVAWNQTLLARKYPCEPAFSHRRAHPVDLRALGPKAAQAFYFAKLGAEMSERRTRKVMQCAEGALMRALDYYTKPIALRAVEVGLGQAPKGPVMAYLAEYVRRGYDLEHAFFQHVLRDMRPTYRAQLGSPFCTDDSCSGNSRAS